MTATKLCMGPCGQTKPFECFHRSAASPDGHKPQCKVCTNEAKRQRRRGDPVQDIFNRGFLAGRDAAGRICIDDATLKAAIALTHPDRQPSERQAEAGRVTAALNAARERARSG